MRAIVLVVALALGGCVVEGPPIRRVRVKKGPRSNQIALRVALREPAAVAGWCRTSGPSEERGEEVLVEARRPGDDHELRLSGLRPTAAYRCRVVALDAADDVIDSVVVDFETGERPVEFTELVTSVDPELGMTGEWTLLVRPGPEPDGDAWLVVYDRQGEARWWHELPRPYQSLEVLHHPEDDVIVWGGGDRQNRDGRPGVVDLWKGEERIDLPDHRRSVFHHDGRRLDDGRFLTLEAVSNTDGERVWEGFRARVYDPVTETVDFEFDSQRYVDEGVLASGGASDPWHANWVDYLDTPRGPVLYVSLCTAKSILAIDGVTGDLRWQLSRGVDWDVLDASLAPIGPLALPRCQHGLEVEPGLDADVVWVYDNGRGIDRSSASRWRIDPARRVAQRLWYWTEPGWKLNSLGDIDVLADDRVLLTMARSGVHGHTQLVEVDVPTGAVASRQRFEENGRGYRAERLDACAVFDRVDRCPDLEARRDALGLAERPR